MDAHERRALPEGWEWKRLGDIITYKKGRKPVALLDEETQGSLQYLTAEYFRTGNSKNFVPKEELSKCISCSAQDIILIWDGSNAGDIFMGLNGVVASTMVKIEPKGLPLNNLSELVSFW
ncbi:MAG: restriction endonuclease subunit S [Euryarchaeota archaeon]|nr:restriction endonuclease subunit S [Euryarchaeota archaeon]